MWKWLVGIGAVLLGSCVGTGYWAYSAGYLKSAMEKFSPESKPMQVRLDPVVKGTLTRTISAPGLLDPRTRVDISAQVSARIVALPFQKGDRVKAGDVVVRLDAVDLAALVDSAKANLKSEQARLEGARASYANALSEAGRRRELFSSKDISKAELDQAELDLSRAESNLRSAEFAIDIASANVRRAEKDLSNTVITAPFDGTITKLDAQAGELVVVGTLNNAGSVIMQIADLSDMLVKAKIDEANIAPIKKGQRAKVFLNPYPDKTFTATVERVGMYRQVDKDGTAYFETELKLDIPEGVALRSGITANSDIEVETLYDVLLVPSQAIQDRNTDELPKDVLAASPHIDRAKKFTRVVYEMVDGKAVTRPVSIGASDLTRTVVLAGLREGVRIVAGPYKSLLTIKEGQKVQDEAEAADKAGEKKAGTAAAGAAAPTKG